MLGSLEQLGNLLDAVGLWPMVFDMLGPVCEISGVLTDVAVLDCPLQSRADIAWCLITVLGFKPFAILEA